MKIENFEQVEPFLMGLRKSPFDDGRFKFKQVFVAATNERDQAGNKHDVTWHWMISPDALGKEHWFAHAQGDDPKDLILIATPHNIEYQLTHFYTERLKPLGLEMNQEDYYLRYRRLYGARRTSYQVWMDVEKYRDIHPYFEFPENIWTPEVTDGPSDNSIQRQERYKNDRLSVVQVVVSGTERDLLETLNLRQ